MRERQKYRAPSSSNASLKTQDSLEHFKQKFPERFFVRLHMTVLLLGVCTSGLIVSKILFEIGLRSMLLRYLIAVCVSYLVFFALMRVWLWYIGAGEREDAPLPDLDVVDAIDLGQSSMDAIGGGIQGFSDPALKGMGGDFGGGGASDVWGSADAASEPVRSSVASVGRGGSFGKSIGLDIDLGDDGIVIVLIVLGLLLLVIFGAGAYLVYAAPEILAEAAFEALLAAGLINASRKITRRGWIGSVLKATWIPFLLVVLMTGIFGWVAEAYFPDAARLGDIFKHSSSADK